MEPDLATFLRGFEQNHVRKDPRLVAVVEHFRKMSQEDLTYAISSLYKITSSDEYKLSWRDAAMSVYMGRLTDQLIGGMSALEASNKQLATKTNELIVAVGDEGGHLTIVVGAVGAFLTAVIAWVSTENELARIVAAVVAVLSLFALGRQIRAHRKKRPATQ